MHQALAHPNWPTQTGDQANPALNQLDITERGNLRAGVTGP